MDKEIQIRMKFYDYKICYICVMKHELWVRFNFLKHCKYNGFRIINTNKKKLMFSERIGKTKTIQVFNYNFKRLRPLK